MKVIARQDQCLHCQSATTAHKVADRGFVGIPEGKRECIIYACKGRDELATFGVRCADRDVEGALLAYCGLDLAGKDPHAADVRDIRTAKIDCCILLLDQVLQFSRRTDRRSEGA